MEFITVRYNAPESNIALDELLLADAEAGRVRETLRFWMSEEYFVVVGRAGKIAKECFADRCRGDGIKIIRRISGGGTVLQGPGSLNYSLVLSYGRAEEFRRINDSYRKILGDISLCLRRRGYNVNVLPVSDMAICGRKVSGNAQARKKNYFLHHGTLLFGMDREKVSRYLRQPSSEPDYRKGREHADFLANITSSRAELEEAVMEAFPAEGGNPGSYAADEEDLTRLVEEKYSRDEWNYQF